MHRIRLVLDHYLTAGSSEAPAARLRSLAVSEVPAIRRKVAQNARTPTHMLAKMAMDPDSQVCIAVGVNKATPYPIISQLVYYDDPDVRFWLASTSHLPKRILLELAQDTNPYVAQRAERTALLMQSGLSKAKMSIFEFLGPDHSLLIARLEKLIEHSRRCQIDIFDETIEAFDCLDRHFERQHKFCLDEISSSNWVSRKLLTKAAQDHNRNHEKIDGLIMSHCTGATDLCSDLRQLMGLVINHIEFAERELYVELRHQVSTNQINQMNARVSQALLTKAI